MVEREREMEAVANAGKVVSLDLGSCWVCEMWRWSELYSFRERLVQWRFMCLGDCSSRSLEAAFTLVVNLC